MADPKNVEVRVLVATGDHQPNDVIELSPAEAKAAEAEGWADSNKDAVAYAKSLAVSEAGEA